MPPDANADREVRVTHRGPTVEAGGSVEGPASPGRKVTKVIVAVHGVGDQYNFATIQSVVNQFCHFHHEPAAVPLGLFHTGKAPYSINPPFSEGTFDHLAFAEVYWAKVPRDVVSDQHTIEEAKKWAGTLVERLRLKWKQSTTKGGCIDADYERVKLVLEEMIQTLAVLERLSYLAAQAGLFTFDLKSLLENYLGDVQIVTEFHDQREKILEAFRQTMEEVNRIHPEAELFIVAHSEGTVISLLGLLRAGRTFFPAVWLERVRGLMTIGSPIDKHLFLWPRLFDGRPPSRTFESRPRIEWRNYYDKGDPIGFDLEDARSWIRDNGWDRVFNFSAHHDYGFVRYPFPGKAHVDYWNDEDVFGHFIETVVKEVPRKASSRRKASDGKRKPPRTLKRWKLFSLVLPYCLVVALMYVGVYFLYKAVDGALDPAKAMGPSTTLHLVGATTVLLLGLTVAARVTRLSRNWPHRFLGWVLGFDLALLGIRIGEGMGAGPDFVTEVSSLAYLVAFLVLALVATVVTALWPSWGLKPLIWVGTAVIVVFVLSGLQREPTEQLGPVWPVFVAMAGFLYLWWLAALILDLVLIWHLLIHHPATARAILRTMAGLPGKQPPRSRLALRFWERGRVSADP
jgi:hypothetical protein